MQLRVCAALFDLAAVPANLVVGIAQRKTALTLTLATATRWATCGFHNPPSCPQHPGQLVHVPRKERSHCSPAPALSVCPGSTPRGTHLCTPLSAGAGPAAPPESLLMLVSLLFPSADKYTSSLAMGKKLTFSKHLPGARCFHTQYLI